MVKGQGQGQGQGQVPSKLEKDNRTHVALGCHSPRHPGRVRRSIALTNTGDLDPGPFQTVVSGWMGVV